MASTTSAPTKRTMLDRIESLGNKVPHPAIIFIPLFIRLGVAPQTLLAASFFVVVLVVWLLFFIAWFVLGIPMGLGYPASL